MVVVIQQQLERRCRPRPIIQLDRRLPSLLLVTPGRSDTAHTTRDVVAQHVCANALQLGRATVGQLVMEQLRWHWCIAYGEERRRLTQRAPIVQCAAPREVVARASVAVTVWVLEMLDHLHLVDAFVAADIL